MNVKPIRTAADHRTALAEIDRLERRNPSDGSAEDDLLEVLYTLVEAYEEEAHEILPPDPIDAIRFRMDQMGWDRKDLEPLIGGRARVSEVLSGVRALSITMIRRLAAVGIPAEVLIREPASADRAGERTRRYGSRRTGARAAMRRRKR